MMGFGKHDAKRIGRATKDVETRPRTTPKQRAKYPVGTQPGLIPAQSASAMTPGSLGSPSGPYTVTLGVPKTGPGFTLTGATMNAYNAYNNNGVNIAANKTLWGTIVNGLYYVVTADC